MQRGKSNRVKGHRKPNPGIIYRTIYYPACWIAEVVFDLFLYIIWLIRMAVIAVLYFGIGFYEGARQGYQEYRDELDGNQSPLLRDKPDGKKPDHPHFRSPLR